MDIDKLEMKSTSMAPTFEILTSDDEKECLQNKVY